MTKASTERAALEADAARYRWLRDVSVPPHNFYLSVPNEFAGIRYQAHEVDAYIDAAILKVLLADHIKGDSNGE